jgi:hypothetical protein
LEQLKQLGIPSKKEHPMKSREDCIKQINAIAVSWGVPPPDVNEYTDEELRNLCSYLDREVEEMAKIQ